MFVTSNMRVTNSKNDNIINMRDFFTFFHLFPLRMLAAILPHRVTRVICISLVHIYSLLPVSKKRRASINEALCLVFGRVKTKKEIRIMTRQCFRNNVYTFMDDLIINKLSKKDLQEKCVIDGLENLENALLEKKGVILVGGHFSGDRVSKAFLRQFGFPIMCVRSKLAANPSMSEVERKYLMPILINIMDGVLKDSVFIEDIGFSIEILKRLRKNGLVSILYDARATTQGINCLFFGNERFFPTNFIHIAYLTGAAVIPMLCIGDSSSFSITFEKKVELQEYPNKEEFISANLNTLVKIFESQILKYPTHWLIL